MIRILLVDDHDMVLEGLRSALSAEADIEVLSTATSVESGLDRYRALTPDVTVTDYRIGERTGAEFCRAIRSFDPNAAIVAISALNNTHTAIDLYNAGCSAFVPKGSRLDELVAAIRAVHEGSVLFPRHIVEAARAGKAPASNSVLTERELDVLQLLGKGLQVTDIAGELHLSTHTVRNHVREILRKLEVTSQLGAVVEATRQGIITSPGPAA